MSLYSRVGRPVSVHKLDVNIVSLCGVCLFISSAHNRYAFPVSYASFNWESAISLAEKYFFLNESSFSYSSYNASNLSLSPENSASVKSGAAYTLNRKISSFLATFLAKNFVLRSEEHTSELQSRP